MKKLSQKFYIEIPLISASYSPGSRKISSVDLQQKFVQFMADMYRQQLIKIINKQMYKHKWAPLTAEYVEYKRKQGLSLRIWEATSLMKNHIVVLRRKDKWYIGPNPKVHYKSGVTLLEVARWMEFGTQKMPARPLFRPTLQYLRSNFAFFHKKFMEGVGANGHVSV